MYCKKCGKLISDDANFCPHCGASSSEPMVSVEETNNTAPCAKKSGVNIVGIIGFVLSIVCLFIDPYYVCSVFAVILSCAGVAISSENGLKGLSIAGLVIGLIGLVLNIVLKLGLLSMYF